MKNLLFLMTVVVGYFFGIYFYCRGFLLTRNALLINSTCLEVQAEKTDACWMEAKYKKAILVVIDALRYDFIAWQTNNSSLPYHNKLISVQNVLKYRPRHGLLYKFVADPPTTTLQRLKALTTGSLPTFVDAGSNFGGSAIEEDNLIDQLIRRNNRKITFMGDDTWVSLFPRQFSRQFPYPSFDVKDLHTVDNGVIEHLCPELNSTDGDWILLIAHFLGVDHCGHKYGPNHPEMAAKLTQLDEVLQSIMSSMEPDTILFVLGDHGMTQTGDHGGDSNDEVSAALFVYSPSELHNEENNVRDAVVQVDLVPTLSMLLDSPIPFSNLGAIIRELFPDDSRLLQAAKANVWQVIRYTENYLTNYPDSVLSERFQPILKVFHILEEDDELTIDKSFEIIRQIGQVFVECWAKFHLGWMTLGILTLAETFLWSLSILFDRNRSLSGRKILLKIFVFLSCTLVLLARNESIPPIVGVILTCQVVVHLHTTASSLVSSTNIVSSMNMPTVLAIFFLILHGVAQFSNSFVVYDDLVSQFIAKTLFFLLYWQNFICKWRVPGQMKVTGRPELTGVAGRSRKKPTLMQSLDSKINLKALFYLIAGIFIVRLGNVFYRCREEQTNCITSPFALPYASLFDYWTQLLRVMMAIVTLFWFAVVPHWFLRKNGHFSGDSFSLVTLMCQIGTGVACISLLSYWVLLWIPDSFLRMFNLDLHQFNPAWIVYGFVFASLLAHFYSPRLSFFQLFDVDQTLKGRFLDPVDAYKHIKSNWRYYFGEKNDNRTVFVYGVQSTYSAGFVSFLWTLIWMVVLLLGDGLSFQVLCFSVVLLIALELNAEHSSMVAIIFLFVELSSHFFYTFGHQTTFSSIPWDAAFVGVPGNFAHQFVQGALVIIHISASYLLITFSLPLLVVWTLYTEKMGVFSVRHPSNNADENELKLSRNEAKFLENVAFYDLTYLSALAIKLIAVVVASAIHRRHLMVWKIFAPKFIFDGILFIVACFCILIQYVFVLRYSKGFLKFLKEIPSS